MKRVLIICAGLCYGGVERFAANISLFAPSDEFVFHYLVFEDSARDFEDEVLSSGAKILRIPSPARNHISYAVRLSRLIKQNRYDVIHSHTQFNSGINLLVGKLLHVPIRIAHSHTTAHEHSIPFFKSLYEHFMRVVIYGSATHFLACGEDAGRWMFGKRSFSVIHNGINTASFAFSDSHRRNIRDRYSISDDEYVIGHAGTLSKLKNQEFLIDLMPRVLGKKPNALLFLLGRGDDATCEHLHNKAKELGVSEKVVFAGPTLKVHEYLSAFDVFAFPSLREGTPLALLEAQTNGLPCVISDAIPADAAVTDLVDRISLKDRQAWLDHLLSMGRKNSEQYAEIMKDKGYDVCTAYEPLYRIYRGN